MVDNEALSIILNNNDQVNELNKLYENNQDTEHCGDRKSHSARVQSPDFEKISNYFHLPVNDAAKQLGICTTRLKKLCRQNGIARWPFRKICSLDKKISTLEVALINKTDGNTGISQEIIKLQDQRRMLIKKPQLYTTNKPHKRAKIKATANSAALASTDAPAIIDTQTHIYYPTSHMSFIPIHPAPPISIVSDHINASIMHLPHNISLMPAENVIALSHPIKEEPLHAHIY